MVATSNVINLVKTLLYPTLGISISLNYLSIPPPQKKKIASFLAHYSVANKSNANQIIKLIREHLVTLIHVYKNF